MNRELLEKPFTPQEIKQREGRQGKVLDYVEAASVIQRLNDAFEGNWSFDLVRYEIREELDEVFVLGKLTAGEVVKTQFGSSEITRTEDGGTIVSLGDDLKAAATDALKKAATLLGVGLHLYAEASAVRPGTQPQPEEERSSRPEPSSSKPHQGFSSGVMGLTRLSAKQHGYIMNLLKDSGLTKRELDEHCRKAYGVVVDHLSKHDASALIDAMMKDGFRPGAGNGGGQNAGNGNGRSQRAAA
jgi:hypothetical protein